MKEAADLITPELLARINELARKKRTVGLTEEELAEQKGLYKIYLAAIRGQDYKHVRGKIKCVLTRVYYSRV